MPTQCLSQSVSRHAHIERKKSAYEQHLSTLLMYYLMKPNTIIPHYTAERFLNSPRLREHEKKCEYTTFHGSRASMWFSKQVMFLQE